MKKIYLLLLCAIVLYACSKEPVTTPDFDVSASALTLKVGQTVTFNITGNPDNVTFYSGQTGQNYDLINRTTAVGKPVLSFTSYAQFLTADNSFRLLISKDFSGSIDSASIVKATWDDITTKATLSTGTNNTPSGSIDLSAYANSTTPITIAFKYKDIPKTLTTLKQATWVINNFALGNQLADTTFKLIQMADNAWGKYSFANSTAVWATTATALTMAGGASTSAANEDWLFSKRVMLSFAKSDVGVAIKDVSSSLSSYEFAYTKAGTYKAVFVASATRYNGSRQTIKTLNITVTP